jgi:hypothetical protein
LLVVNALVFLYLLKVVTDRGRARRVDETGSADGESL